LFLQERALFANNDICKPLLQASRGQGVSGEMNNLPNTMARGPQKRGA